MGQINLLGYTIPIVCVNTLVVGSGAAGLAAAERLASFGQKSICIVTEGCQKGTSCCTGSDKQTYYKLALAGETEDSPRKMARTLFDGGSMDGDLALVEAALSVRCFYHLCELGVPFPTNDYGEYVGYQTDHDPLPRGTSVGPLTSQYMHEKLLARVRQQGIQIYEQMLAIRILKNEAGVTGLLAIDLNAKERERQFVLFHCTNLIYATGGPAGLYESSVYPESQIGMTGIALEAGVRGKNLGEWQYGIASTKFRWNLSGSYQQVLPRYVSTDANGNDPRDFLAEGFSDVQRLLDATFKKGYQWPFDPTKLNGEGSSLIDLLVYRETVLRGRRVFLDYRINPLQLEAEGRPDFFRAGKVAYNYLHNSHAMQDTPVQRLRAMNEPAYQLYLAHGIDLEREPLEIAVCAQHSNGGLAADMWWESNLPHFFAIGEVCGSHGVKRPGGSALNAGQVGALRAAERIWLHYRQDPEPFDTFWDTAKRQVENSLMFAASLQILPDAYTVLELRHKMQHRMSCDAAQVRSEQGLQDMLDITERALQEFSIQTTISGWQQLPEAFRNRDILLTQWACLHNMLSYIRAGGESRGSYLIVGAEKSEAVLGICYSLEEGAWSRSIFETWFEEGRPHSSCRLVRPIPESADWFEEIWKRYRKTHPTVL